MLNHHLLAALAEARTADLHRAVAARSAGAPRRSRARHSALRVAIASAAQAVTRVAKKRPLRVTETR